MTAISWTVRLLESLIWRITISVPSVAAIPGIWKQKENQDRAYEKAYEKQQEHIKETEEYIRRYKAGIKAKQARGVSQLNRLVRLEKPVHQASLRFHFDPPQECADKVLDVLRVEGSYGSHILFKDLTIHIKKGETVGLIRPQRRRQDHHPENDYGRRSLIPVLSSWAIM